MQRLLQFVMALAIASICINSAKADLYAEGMLSLEWLVDSCDTIVLIKGPASPDGAGPKDASSKGIDPNGSVQRSLEIVKVIKGNSDSAKAAVGGLAGNVFFKQKLNLAPGDRQWLFFFRDTDLEKPKRGFPTWVWSINLEHPKRSPYTAAITMHGEVLASQEEILKQVRNRIKLARPLPKRFSPKLVDNLVLRNDWPQRHMGAFSPAGLEHYLGGFPQAVDCDKWSLGLEEYGGLGDILVTHLAVPADAEFRDAIIKALQANLNGEKINNSERLTYSLINYQDPQVKELLEQIANLPGSKKTNVGGSIDPVLPGAARKVLQYWQFLEDAKSASNQQVVGTWEITYGQTKRTDQFSPTYTVIAELKDDQSLSAKGYERGNDQPLWKGTGYWVAANDELTIATEETTAGSKTTGDSWAATHFSYHSVMDKAKLNASKDRAVEKESNRVAEKVR